MSVIKYHHKRSEEAHKRPTENQLSVGELALNYNTAAPGIFMEDSAGKVVKIGPAEVGAEAPNINPAGTIGNSAGELWLNTTDNKAIFNVFDGDRWREINSEGGDEYLKKTGDDVLGDLTFTQNADLNFEGNGDINVDGQHVLRLNTSASSFTGNSVQFKRDGGQLTLDADLQTGSILYHGLVTEGRNLTTKEYVDGEIDRQTGDFISRVGQPRDKPVISDLYFAQGSQIVFSENKSGITLSNNSWGGLFYESQSARMVRDSRGVLTLREAVRELQLEWGSQGVKVGAVMNMKIGNTDINGGQGQYDGSHGEAYKGKQIKWMAAPTHKYDATTKQYVDNLVKDSKDSSEAFATDLFTSLSNTIEGVTDGFIIAPDLVAVEPLRNFKVGDDDLFVNVSNNHVGIGTHNPQKSLDILSNDSSNRATARVQQWSNDNKGPWFNLTKGRGTDAQKQKVQYNDTIGELYFNAWTGTYTTSGIIRCDHTGTNSEGYGKLSFKTRGPDGLKTRMYTQSGGEVAVTKGLVLLTENTSEDNGTFSMRDYTDNSDALSVIFTKYRGNNPVSAEESGGIVPAANLNDRLLPGDGVVKFAFGGWDGTHRKNISLFTVNCVDDNLTGEVHLGTRKAGVDAVADRFVIDGDGHTHIKNGNLVIESNLTVLDTDITRLELSRLSGITGNAQTQFDDRIKKSELLQMVQENTNYEDFRAALINLLT